MLRFSAFTALLFFSFSAASSAPRESSAELRCSCYSKAGRALGAVDLYLSFFIKEHNDYGVLQIDPELIKKQDAANLKRINEVCRRAAPGSKGKLGSCRFLPLWYRYKGS